MATITLANYRTLIRRIAEARTLTPATAFVTDDELTEIGNEAMAWLYDLFIQIQVEEWLPLSTQTITLVSGTDSYALANGTSPVGLPAFYVLKGVRGRSGGVERQLEPWEHQARAPLETSGLSPRVWDLRYRLSGSNIILKPTPRTTDSVLVDYIGQMTPMSGVQASFDMPQYWWRAAALKAAIDVLAMRGNPQTSAADLLTAQLEREVARITAIMDQRDQGRAARVIDTRRDELSMLDDSDLAWSMAMGTPALWPS